MGLIPNKRLSGKKKIAFEYIVLQLLKWYQEENPKKDAYVDNDLSKLKVLKLLFFVSAVNANDDNDGLLDTFIFHAMPYGHVELDIYDNMDNFEIVEINNERTIIKSIPPKNYFEVIKDIISKVDQSISLLKQKNKDLINYKAFKLVELSHLWFSWNTAYEFAQKNNKNIFEIPNSLIKTEIKQYYLY